MKHAKVNMTGVNSRISTHRLQKTIMIRNLWKKTFARIFQHQERQRARDNRKSEPDNGVIVEQRKL